jgi:hypothetical protein
VAVTRKAGGYYLTELTLERRLVVREFFGIHTYNKVRIRGDLEEAEGRARAPNGRTIKEGKGRARASTGCDIKEAKGTTRAPTGRAIKQA